MNTANNQTRANLSRVARSYDFSGEFFDNNARLMGGASTTDSQSD